MKRKICSVVVIAILTMTFSVACGNQEVVQNNNSAEGNVGTSDNNSAVNSEVTKAPAKITATNTDGEGKISKEEAERIALEHAGLTSEEVTGLHSEYEKDEDEYEVKFYSSEWEYEYTIQAEAGAILSYDQEN